MTAVPIPEVQRFTCISIVADTSGSMDETYSGKHGGSETKMQGMLRGLKEAIQYCRNHPTLSRSAVFSLTTVNESPADVPFTSVQQFPELHIQASGRTPLGAALHRATDGIADYLHGLNSQGLTWTKPTMVIITDGAPNGEPSKYVEDAIDRVRELVVARKIFVLALGVTAEDVARIESLQIAHGAIEVGKVGWSEAFRVVSASAASLAQGQQPLLPTGGTP
jgi:uncharacterized protein YegL